MPQEEINHSSGKEKSYDLQTWFTDGARRPALTGAMTTTLKALGG